MNFDETLIDTIASKYFRIIARRAAIRAEIEELFAQVREMKLLLDALQAHRRSKYIANVAKAFGLSTGAAINEQRNIRALAIRPISKGFFEQNGLLPPQPRKTPKATKPVSPIGKAGQLSAEILKAKERGLNPQEIVVLTDILDRLKEGIS